MSAFDYSEKVDLSVREREEFLRFAVQVVRDAGKATLPYFRADVAVENKLSGDFDPVTQADKSAELEIRSRIEDSYANHGILGEEFGYLPGNGLTWVIDPIDGTKSFLTGMLHWGVLLALFDGETPVIGAMYQPYTDEIFYGDGATSWFQRGELEPVRMATGSCEDVSSALMATTGIRYYQGEALVAFNKMVDATRMCRLGGDCYLFATLALGQLDLVSESSLNPFDIQALVPIVRGAGGVVTCFDGGNPSMGGSVIASGNETLHRKVLDLIGT